MSAIVILALSCLTFLFLILGMYINVSSYALTGLFVSLSTLLAIILTIWFVVDAFLTNNNVNKYNTNLAVKLGLLDSNFISYIK